MRLPPTLLPAALLAGFALTLGGCATLSKDECRTANWYDIGAADGRNGELAGRIEKHRKACAEYNVLPREHEYFAGREAGLRDYCQLRNAFRTGLDGNKYKGVCPPEIDRTYRRYNDAAYEIYRLRKEIESVEDRIYDRERLLDDKEETKLTRDERRRIRDEIRDLDRRRDRLRDDLRRADLDLDRMMDDLRQRRQDYPQ